MEEEKSKSTAPQDGSVEEKRVRPTVIRRRRKVAAAEPKAEPKVEEEAPKKEGAPEEVTAAEVGVEKEEKGGEEASEAVKVVEGKPQEKGEVVEPKAVEEQVKVPTAVKPTPTATKPSKDKKGKKDLNLPKRLQNSPKRGRRRSGLFIKNLFLAGTSSTQRGVCVARSSTPPHRAGSSRRRRLPFPGQPSRW